jgi:hypothetical protein
MGDERDDTRDLLRRLVTGVQPQIEELKRKNSELRRQFDEVEIRRQRFIREWEGEGPNTDGWRDKIKGLAEEQDKYGAYWPRLERFVIIMDTNTEGDGTGLNWLHYAKDLRVADIMGLVTALEESQKRVKWLATGISTAVPIVIAAIALMYQLYGS